MHSLNQSALGHAIAADRAHPPRRETRVKARPPARPPAFPGLRALLPVRAFRHP